MSDAEFYSMVAKELAEQKLDQGLWLKARTTHPENENLAQSLYVKLRVEELRGEHSPKKDPRERLSVKQFLIAVGAVALFLWILVLIGTILTNPPGGR